MREIQSYKSNNFFFKSPIGFVYTCFRMYTNECVYEGWRSYKVFHTTQLAISRCLYVKVRGYLEQVNHLTLKIRNVDEYLRQNVKYSPLNGDFC